MNIPCAVITAIAATTQQSAPPQFQVVMFLEFLSPLIVIVTWSIISARRKAAEKDRRAARESATRRWPRYPTSRICSRRL